MATLVDPWSGFDKSVTSLASAADTYDRRRRQAEQDAMTKSDWEFKKAERERALADEMNLRAVYGKAYTGKDVTSPNPDYVSESDQILGLEAAQNPPLLAQNTTYVDGKMSAPIGGDKYNEAQQAGRPVPDQMRSLVNPMSQTINSKIPYSDKERGNMIAQEYLKQGKYAEAFKANQGVLDITHLNAESDRKKLANDTQRLIQYTMLMENPKEARKKLATEIRMEGRTEDADLMEKSELFNGARVIKDDTGGTIVIKPDVNGMATITHEKAVKPPTGKFPGMPVIETVGGKKMKGQYIFNTEAERDAYEKTRIPKGGNWESNFGDKSTTVIIGSGGSKDGTDAIPVPVAKMLEPAQKTASTSQRLSTSFDPSYTVAKVPKSLGDGIVAIKKQYGEDSEAANWWTDYQGYKNQVRNELFGSALTDTEAREFDKANINPGMSAAQIKKNLARQQEISVAAYERLRSGQLPSKKFGKTVDEVYPSLAKPKGNAPPKAGDVVKGYKFLGGDPANKASWRKQ